MLVLNTVVAAGLSARLVVVVARVTACVSLFDVLAEKLPSPAYTALSVCGLAATDSATWNVA